MPRSANRTSRVFACCLFAALAGCSPKGVSGPRAARDLAIVFTQVPLRNLSAATDRTSYAPEFPPGTRIVLWRAGNPARVEVLSEGFSAAADPCVSFAGDSLLFAGKRSPTDHWDIWVMRLPNGPPRRVTEGMGNSRSPIFLPLSAITGPEFVDKVRWISYTSTVDSIPDPSGRDFVPTLYCRSLDRVETAASVQSPGYVTWRSTYNLTPVFSPTVLADGRIAYGYLRRDTGSSALPAYMTVNWEGTDPNPFFAPVDGSTSVSMGVEGPDRSFVFVESRPGAPFASGALARIWMRRPLHTRSALSTRPGNYAYPHATPDGRILVSFAKTRQDFAIHWLDAATGDLGERVFHAPGWAVLQAQLVSGRPEPLGRITMIVDSKPSADLHCLNVYDSQLDELRSLPKGTIRSVRIIEGIPAHGTGASQAGNVSVWSRVVGEGVVEEDGSFNLVVPGSTPLRFQLLDSTGTARATMRNWAWLHRRDQRGCIGCHENPELAPENRATTALLRIRADTLMAPPNERQTFSFSRDVRPILERSCAPCHGASHRSGFSLGTDQTASYSGLFAQHEPTRHRFVEKGSARTSVLVWAVRGETFGNTSSAVRRMPPRAPIPAADIRTITAWIDLDAPF